MTGHCPLYKNSEERNGFLAVEKMSLVTVSGPIRRANKALIRCCETGCFHIEPSLYAMTYGSAHFKTLKDKKNIYGNLIKRMSLLASGLGIPEKNVPYDDIQMEVIHDFDVYLSAIESDTASLIETKKEIEERIDKYEQAMRYVENLDLLDTDFRNLTDCKYVKVRFGRLPSDNYKKLRFFSDKGFVFVPLEENEGYVWGVYFTSYRDCSQNDEIFSNLYYERIYIPDYVSGNGQEAKNKLNEKIAAERKELDEVLGKLAAVRQREEEKFCKVRSKLRFLNDSYELRSKVAVVDNKFYMLGFVPTRELSSFKEKILGVQDVEISEQQYFLDDKMKPPTKLKNNRVFKPFEMFVTMYGLPSYTGIDPTSFVAITYMLLYGIMFGDLGQGLVISLLGFIFWKWKKLKLGLIMERIGISSAVFGYFYGSVFGNEELITPFYHIPQISEVLGHPKNIFEVSSYLLIAALMIGVVLIIITMVFNIILSFKRQDYASALFGANGFAGMLFYVSLIAGVACQMGLGIELMTTPYVVCLILLPLAVMLFKEPLSTAFSAKIKKSVLSFTENLVADNSVRAFEQRRDKSGAVNIDKLADMKYIRSVYGAIPKKALESISDISEKDIAFVPISEDGDKICGVYFASKKEKAAADDIFDSLGFERRKMPKELLEERKKVKKSEKGEKKSVGGFLIEGFIELFETCLSYLTNTMSFLRVGGFILSHAGMMLVVGALSGSDMSASYIIVQILGNAFVIGMEGFIVGIQVLRLEFYELFGRFYISDGKEFTPLKVNN